ncbi:MAG: 4-hydroxy-3-methylbut-2-enyl diphosphate reductase [candidate division WOR-3 bacterium]
MPQVIVAQPTGFCFGVERAIQLVKKGLAKWGRVFTYGELVHNPLVVRELKSLGVKELKSLRRLNEVGNGALVIRAHGCPPAVIEECQRQQINVIDATCPYVRRVQNVARKLTEEGYQVVVVGEKNHPEVKAILAAAGKTAQVYPPNPKKAFKGKAKLGVVAQTTIDRNSFKEKVAKLLNFCYTEIRVFDTVCAEVVARQEAAVRIAKRVAAVVVVGGKNSANTRRLVNIVRRSGKPVVHITRAKDLDVIKWRHFEKVGIVAGASTPAETVEEIAQILKNSGCPEEIGNRVLRRSVRNV